MHLMPVLSNLRDINVITRSGALNGKWLVILSRHPSVEEDIYACTQFLDDDTSLKERIICIMRGITHRPTCKNASCNNQCSWISSKGGKFRDFCSTKCSNSDAFKQQQATSTKQAKYGDDLALVVEKGKETTRQRYGVDHVMQLDEFKHKQQQTTYKRHGVFHPLQSQQIRDKHKQTCLEKYGVPHTLQHPDIRERIKQTNFDKYGESSVLTTDWHIKHKRDVLIAKHGVDHQMKSDVIKQQMRDRYQQEHGVDHPLSNPNIRRDILTTTRERYGRDSHTQRHIPKRVIAALNNVRWMRYQHHHLQKSLTSIADELGVDPTTVMRYRIDHDIDLHRYNYSTGHRQISHLLTQNGIDHTNNDRTVVAPRELDIYVPQHNLAIEYCGLYWHSEQKGRGGNYHLNKLHTCQQAGIRLLTIYEDEWLDHSESISEKILSLCGVLSTNRIYARQCTVVEVPVDKKNRFFNRYHVQGSGPGSITYGLTSQDMLVACMTFIRKAQGVFYLNRYATCRPVVGGFSKLLKHFERNHAYTQIVSFADQRWSVGDLYRKTGFDLDKVIPPDYCYSVDGKRRIHKFNYRRKYLPQKLHTFDPSKSERQNCDDNGLLRIWDCGKMRFVKTNVDV